MNWTDLLGYASQAFCLLGLLVMLIYGGMKIPRFGRPAVWMVAGFAILLVAKVILYIGHRAIVSSIDDLGGRQNMYMMLSFMSTVTSMLTLLGNCVIGSSVFMNRETQKTANLSKESERVYDALVVEED